MRDFDASMKGEQQAQKSVLPLLPLHRLILVVT